MLNPLADHWAKLWTMDRRWLLWLGFCGLLWLIDYLYNIYYFLLNLYENPFCECAPARPAESLVLAAVSTKKVRKMFDGERLVKDDQWISMVSARFKHGPCTVRTPRATSKSWPVVQVAMQLGFPVPSGRSPGIQPDVNQ